MNKILVIANREFRAIVGTKAFLIVITLMPVLMFGGIAVQKMLEGRVGPTKRRSPCSTARARSSRAWPQPPSQHNETRNLRPPDRQADQAAAGARSRPGGRSDRGNTVPAFRADPPPSDRRIPGNPRRHRPHAGRGRVRQGAVSTPRTPPMMEEQGWLRNALGNVGAMRRLQAANIDPTLVDRASRP